MLSTVRDLGDLVRAYRGASRQEDIAAAVGTNRSAIAHLEQGRRLPARDLLRRICAHLRIPESVWASFDSESFRTRIQFEDLLSELVGRQVSLTSLDSTSVSAAEQLLASIFGGGMTEDQLFDACRAMATFYGMQPMSHAFFRRYLGTSAFRSIALLGVAIQTYQRDAIRLFSTISEAFDVLASSADLNIELQPLEKRSLQGYVGRTEWDRIAVLPDERLPDLGYIAAGVVRQERAERNALSRFLRDTAAGIRANGAQSTLYAIKEKTRRRMDSLLRKFESKLQHGFGSSLFSPDPDQLEREATSIAPIEGDIDRIGETQSIARQNLANYLATEFLDVYVATSMRVDADFVSVNQFVTKLFAHPAVAPLKLRYFNPTQSWIEDRVAKGLVEALMLRRAGLAIYMAQKSDTFGKDSEASVALGQGKPVIVYVPKLHMSAIGLDSEQLWVQGRSELERQIAAEGSEEDEVDETTDIEALASRLMSLRLANAAAVVLSEAAQHHWADFDLYGEANVQISNESERAEFRAWLDAEIGGQHIEPTATVRAHLVKILVSTAARFERRAKTFRTVHPLAIQVIVSSGVLNGILVARSVASCAAILRGSLENDLDLELKVDDNNYMLVETTTQSTVRVISRHELLRNAFSTYYSRRATHE